MDTLPFLVTTAEDLDNGDLVLHEYPVSVPVIPWENGDHFDECIVKAFEDQHPDAAGSLDDYEPMSEEAYKAWLDNGLPRMYEDDKRWRN